MSRTLPLLLALSLAGCGGGEKPAEQKQRALTHFAQWVERARAGERDDALCHGLGLLKHREYSCAEMLDAAAIPEPSSRTISDFGTRDCLKDVCGTFYEFDVAGSDAAGNEIEESVVLKEDEGRIQTYWFRSSTMLAALETNGEDADDEGKTPEQVAYDRLIALYPALYSYPPCYGVRASSSNLAGPLTAIDQIDVSAVEAVAEACGPSFCFGLVGQKIAPLCPDASK